MSQVRIKVQIGGPLGRALAFIARRIERTCEVRYHRQLLDACGHGTPGAVRALLSAPAYEIEVGRARS